MDTALSGSRLNDEKAFAHRFTAGLEAHPVSYPVDFVTPLEERPRKVQVLAVRGLRGAFSCLSRRSLYEHLLVLTRKTKRVRAKVGVRARPS